MSGRKTTGVDLMPDCPRCGSPVELILDGMIATPIATAYTTRGHDRQALQWRLAAFGACTGCELCIEIRPKGHAHAN